MSGLNNDPEFESSVTRMVEIFDVAPSDPAPSGSGSYSGVSDGGSRAVVDGSQLLGQAIVAVAKTTGKSVRSAHVVFSRAVRADAPVEFLPDVVHNGRTAATTTVAVTQDGRRCATVTVLSDVPTADLIRHSVPRPAVAGPADAYVCDMPMTGRQIRLVDVVDVNSPDEVGPPELHAWLRYDPIPDRDDLAKALLAHFTGHLSISTTMRPYTGIGTSQAHGSITTAPVAIDVAFHEPVTWDGWILYSHHSVAAGAGTSHVLGQIHTEDGALLATFSQQAIIREFARPEVSAIPESARL